MDLQKEISDLILDNLKKTLPAKIKEMKMDEKFIDRSTEVLGFSKITKPGYTP